MNAQSAEEVLQPRPNQFQNHFTSGKKMDISEYLKLQIKRGEYKSVLNEVLGKDLSSVLNKYEKQLNIKIGKLLKSGTLTVSNLDELLKKFIAELTATNEEIKKLTAQSFIELHELAKKSLDVKYNVDYQLLPKHIPDSQKLRSEIQAIIEKFRKNEFTQTQMQRLVSKRLRIPSNTAYTITNTQIAGLDNSASKAIADLAFLEDVLYFGPTGNSREFCEERVGRIFTIKQIEEMDNGQGLPVIRYCGGYNCLHELIYVNRSWKELKEYL